MTESKKPRVFIASSSEREEEVGAIVVRLRKVAETVAWTEAFTIGQGAIDSLVKLTSNIDFAIFLFSPDDLSTIRKVQERTVRDNVLFEFGLFVGAIGKDRCFIIKPHGIETHFPSDLLGITFEEYEQNRGDQDLTQAMMAACHKITGRLNELGCLEHHHIQNTSKPIVNPNIYNLDKCDIEILCFCMNNDIIENQGLSINGIVSMFGFGKALSISKISLCVEKLCRMGLLDKRVGYRDEVFMENQEYQVECYLYSTTSLGVDEAIKKESLIE